jgi:hypothetical protein
MVRLGMMTVHRCQISALQVCSSAGMSGYSLGWGRSFCLPESDADEIVVSPNQATVSDRSEIVEGQIEVHGNDVETV